MFHFFVTMVAGTELFLGGLFNMIRWFICVIGIAVDNLGRCRLKQSKENRGSVAGFSLDCYLAYKIVKRDVYLIAARLFLVIDS